MVTDALIARCARRETKAQFELYRALYPMMMAICSRYERDGSEAKARMNQGFLKILDNIGTRRPEVPFDAWARRIMINTVIDVFRRSRVRKLPEADVDPVNVDVAEVNEYLREMEAEAFAHLLAQVPPASRNVFNLFAVDGYSHAEIAELLDISEGTSKWHVAHARTILQNALARSMSAVTRPTAP
jgi:RNA polymerase sigma factor (sigma-70 family)